MSHLYGTDSAEWNVDSKVLRRFFLKNKALKSTFIEVGAARPDYLSISKLFRNSGWNVISVEPNPEFCRLQREAGNDVLEFACGDRDDEDVPFTVVDSRTTESGEVTYESFSSLGMKQTFKAIAPANLQIRQIKVRMRRLSTLIDAYAADSTELSILSVDVEGWELEVLDGLDFSRHRPKCIILENLFSDTRYRTYLLDRGYRLWRTLPPNEVYINEEMRLSPLETSLYRVWDSFFCAISMRLAFLGSGLNRARRTNLT
jgi:FkbM family methyltransferase